MAFQVPVAAGDAVTLSPACLSELFNCGVLLEFLYYLPKEALLLSLWNYHRSSSVCLIHQLRMTNSGKQINSLLARVNWLVSF